MPLKLSLKPNEKFVVNGAVLANGDRRASLAVQNSASILREKDIMQPGEATTPARRIYFPIMMMYLEDGDRSVYYDEFVLRMSEFIGAIRDPQAVQDCVAISRAVMAGDYYKALIGCRRLFGFEEERLSHVPSGLSESALGE